MSFSKQFRMLFSIFLFSIFTFSLSSCSSSSDNDSNQNLYSENNLSSDINNSEINSSAIDKNESNNNQNNENNISDKNNSTSSNEINSSAIDNNESNNSQIIKTGTGEFIKVLENPKYKVIARENKTIILNLPSTIQRVSQSLKRSLKAVTDKNISNVTLSIYYPDNSAYFEDYYFTNNNGSWTIKLLDFPIIEESYRFVVNIYNSSNQKIMSGEVSKTLTEETLDILIPVEFIDEVQVALSTIQNIIITPAKTKDGNVTVTFQISNPSRDSGLTYSIIARDNNLTDFYKYDGSDGKNGTVSNNLTSEFSLYITNSFIKDKEYNYYITLQASNGNKVRQAFKIFISVETVSPMISLQKPLESEDVFIFVNDKNITLEAVFSNETSARIQEINWSLANNSFSFINNKSNPAIITGFDGNISDTILLTIIDKNGTITFETYILNLNDSISPQIPTILYSTFANKTTTNISISGEPSAKLVVNHNLTSSTISAKGILNYPLNLLKEGENNFSIALEDLSGNRSDEVNFTIIRDTTPPKTDASITFFETDLFSPELNGSLPSKIGDDNVSKYRVEIILNNETKPAIVYGTKWGIIGSTFADIEEEGYYDINITVYDELNNSATTNIPNAFRISNSAFIIKPLIEGLYYVCGAKNGKTNISGMFKYEKNSNLTLYLGDGTKGINFGTLEINNFLEINGSRKEINFLKLVNSSQTQDSQRAKNAIRLLASLDADKDLSNGIMIDNETIESFILANPNINLDLDDTNFSTQLQLSDIFNDLAVHFSEHRGLISAEDSQAIVTALINGTIITPTYSIDPEANISILQGKLQSVEGSVEGIAYRSGSQSGFTDENGTFYYEDSKKIRFSIGMMELSETDAKTTMTPYDMVESVSFNHPKPRNIASLFTLFDSIANDSKVTIDQAVRDAIDKFRSPIDLNLPDGTANSELNISAGVNEFMAQFSGFEIGAELLNDINNSRQLNGSGRILSNLRNLKISANNSLESLQALQISATPDKQVEKIFNNVKDFHIFLKMFNWNNVDVTTLLINGDSGIPIFSPRNEPNPVNRDYPIDYNKPIERYKPVSPPISVANQYTQETLGNKETATYNAPIISAGVIGKGRVLAMSSYLYASILVNPKNYSNNGRNNNKTDTKDSVDMENFFHNVFSWLSESNPSAHYDQNGSTINIATNKEFALFWSIGGWDYASDRVPFVIHPNFKVNQVKVTDFSQLDPAIYPIFILEEFGRHNSDSSVKNYLNNETDINYLLEYARKGGSILIIDSFWYKNEPTTIVEKILDKAGIYIVRNQHNNATLLPKHNEVGGVHQYDMCVQDYISLTDLERKLGLTTYENVPQTKDLLIQAIKTYKGENGWEGNLDEVLKNRKRIIYKKADINKTFSENDCNVSVTDQNGTTINVKAQLIKGDGISGDGDVWYQVDNYAKYPVDLNFIQAQGDMGGKMNNLLAHENGITKMREIDVEREYTNMYALLMNDANFSGEKFVSLNELLSLYKDLNSSKVNAQGEFDPLYQYLDNSSNIKVLNYREKPVTRIMLERAFYDSNLKADPTQFPGKVTGGKEENATIYLRKISAFAQWYARNMQSTGLFAPANKEITITVPNGVNFSKLQVQVAMSDNVSGLIKHELILKRPPRMVKKYEFESNNLTFKHPYGGLIYIASHDSNPTTETATLTFNGVEKAILFKLDETTETEWDNMKTSSLAPLGEILSHHFVVTVPQKNIANLTFAEITDIAKGFDEVAINSNDFYGFDRNCSINISDFTVHTPPTCETRKGYQHREVFDPHISIGDGHSGYPIMVMNWKPFSSKFPQNPRNDWLLWHELGHNTAVNWLTIPGSTEVANNVMALYQQHKFNLPLRTDERISSVDLIIAKSQSYGDSGAFGRLLMFAQIPLWVQDNYLNQFKVNNPKYYENNGSIKTGFDFLDNSAWDIYKIMHRETRENNNSANYRYSACAENNNLTITESFATCISSILHLDLSSFMEDWEAGTVGVGAIDGINIYDNSGGFGSAGKTAISNMNLVQPTTPIQNYKGN